MECLITKKFSLTILLLLFISISNIAQQRFDYYEDYEKFQSGDSLGWKNINYNDTNWDYYNSTKLDFQSSTMWFRCKIITNTINIPSNKLGLSISLTGTYQLFWNGVYIGTNCSSGNDIFQNNGILVKTLRFPDSLNIFRQNMLAIRIFIPDGQYVEFPTLEINNYDSLSEVPTSDSIFLLVLFIIHMMLAIYYLRAFNKNKLLWHYLLFAILLVLIALNISFETISYLIPITYKSIMLVDQIEFYLTLLLLFSFPLFFMLEFNLKFRITALVLSAIFIVGSYFYFDQSSYFQAVALTPGIVIALWAFYLRKEGGINAIFGMFVFISILLSRNDISLMKISFIVFPFFISISLSKQYFRQKRQYQIAKTQSARLESEMLRKIIQPHYLMNSLNAALDWLEVEPEKGVEFIHALSGEFRDFSRTSNLKLIPIKDEINMCRGHLEIMKYRQDKNYQLFEENINYDKTVPPAIFHTIIENGITHEPSDSENAYFIIKEEKLKGGIKYRIISIYSPNSELSDMEGNKSSFLKGEKKESVDCLDGTGFTYIKARLTESYGNKWNIVSYSYSIGWETVIEIYKG